MNIERVDLNLLVYLDVLLREKNVTRAAEHLGITQPAMSNILKKLRDVFEDPLLIRSSEGMAPTERALDLQPKIREALGSLNQIFESPEDFRPRSSSRVFRIMAADYAEATLIPALAKAMRTESPGVVLDFLTPSDVSYRDMEQGKVDMAINRFTEIPQSFHQVTVWKDSFSCLVHRDSPIADRFNLKSYLEAQHIWVSKTGMGVGFGMNPDQAGGLGWIDQALGAAGQEAQDCHLHPPLPDAGAAGGKCGLGGDVAYPRGEPAGANLQAGDQGAAIPYTRVRTEDGLEPAAAPHPGASLAASAHPVRTPARLIEDEARVPKGLRPAVPFARPLTKTELAPTRRFWSCAGQIFRYNMRLSLRGPQAAPAHCHQVNFEANDMSERIQRGDLEIAKELYDFIGQPGHPGIRRGAVMPTGAAFEQVAATDAPKNKALLAKRDDLQAKIDAWHRANPFFRSRRVQGIPEGDRLSGAEEGADSSISTQNVDEELAVLAGPQLVVPVRNARYAFNAANARWGSLYDALYGTDVIP
jgi:DNA-binding transcriptional LysR family regulator